MYESVFLISLYGAPLTLRVSYLALHSSLFGWVAQLIMITNGINSLLIGSRSIPNGTVTHVCIYVYAPSNDIKNYYICHWLLTITDTSRSKPSYNYVVEM